MCHIQHVSNVYSDLPVGCLVDCSLCVVLRGSGDVFQRLACV